MDADVTKKKKKKKPFSGPALGRLHRNGGLISHNFSIKFYPLSSEQIPACKPPNSPPKISPSNYRNWPLLPFSIPVFLGGGGLSISLAELHRLSKTWAKHAKISILAFLPPPSPSPSPSFLPNTSFPLGASLPLSLSVSVSVATHQEKEKKEGEIV